MYKKNKKKPKKNYKIKKKPKKITKHKIQKKIQIRNITHVNHKAKRGIKNRLGIKKTA